MEQILADKKFQNTLATIAEDKGVSLDDIRQEATEYLKELHTTQTPIVDALAVEASQYILGRAYEKTIDVNPDEMKALSNLMRRHSVAFVMTHKTYIDMMVLGLVLARHGLPVPHIFAGINMAFLGVGEIGRKAGVIFIRRSFKNNPVYKATLRHFISWRVKARAHFMWAIEGTRSRTGKLVWPKMGILKYIVESEKSANEEVKYVPVSVVYDLIPDVDDMTKESRGQTKKPESLLWFLNYIRKMGDDYGKISIRFGDPITRDNERFAEIPDDSDDQSPDTSYTLPHFAFELIHGINKITPVTTASLICTTLLCKFALTKSRLEQDVISLMHLIENHQPDVLVDRGQQIGASVQQAINILKNASLIQQLGEGVKAKYALVTENFLSATYYANMAVHHLYKAAFIELALVRVMNEPKESRALRFWEEIMQIRDLFKFEFFYSRKPIFSDEIEKDLDYLDPNWRQLLEGSAAGIKRLLSNQGILLSQAILSIYLEAYQVVAKALLTIDRDVTPSEANLLHACMFVGDELHWQGRIHRIESVSKPLLQNGIRLVKNMGLVPSKENPKTKEIEAFIDHLVSLMDNIRTIQDIVQREHRGAKIIPIDRKNVPGSRTQAMTSMVIEGPSGPHIGAFFDLDRTLIKGFSAKQFFRSRLLSGKMSAKEIIAQFSGVMVYAIGNRNFAGLAAIGAKGVKGTDERLFIEVGEEVYYKHLAQEIYPESRALVDAHLAKGHTVAIISAATPYQVNPIARDLGVEHVMCTRMEVKDGKFTGQIVEPACWGEGKSIAARELANRFNLDLSKSYFYTDSAEDLPLMEIVGFPRPVNPDNELSSIAYQNDWPVYRFNDERRPVVSNLARTFLAFGSIIPAAFIGALSGATSMSYRDGVNSMIGVVGDIGTRIAGIKIVVKGEEHLWSHRPAVFLFNHQSNADFLIAAKLLKKDVVAIAKKELELSPIGPFFKAAGIIFIDRKNKEKAIEAMKPAVIALQSGTSLAIAPEGTRSFDYNLGPFKKGAFHLAMQAGVPVVPMVIKNAHDVMPRGAALIQPTIVEIEILPPVHTNDWTKENLNDKISEVRALFLKALGQDIKALPQANGKVKSK